MVVNALLVVLRVIHICSGIYWAGASVALGAFVMPSARAIGSEGGKFMQHLLGPGRLPVAMGASAVLTNISGLILFGMVHGFRLGMLQTGFGLSLSLGSIIGLVAMVHGGAVEGRLSSQMDKLTKEIQSAGKPPSAEQAALLQTLQVKVSRGQKQGAVMLVLSALAMAAARAL